MKRKVVLEIGLDEMTGEWGVYPAGSMDCDHPFNSSWVNYMIFHDVFEHYFEEENKYFRDKYAFNVAGEIAAMGHLAYYVQRLGLGRIRSVGQRDIDVESIVVTTQGMISEACYGHGCPYGETLECNLPRQKDLDESDLSYVINDHIYRLDTMRDDIKNSQLDDEDAIKYLNSVTDRKIIDLYTWGWKQAAKIIPDNNENYQTVEKFFERFSRFTKYNSAEEIANHFSEMIFTTETVKGILKWKCEFRSIYNGELVPMDLVEEGIYSNEVLEEEY